MDQLEYAPAVEPTQRPLEVRVNQDDNTVEGVVVRKKIMDVVDELNRSDDEAIRALQTDFATRIMRRVKPEQLDDLTDALLAIATDEETPAREKVAAIKEIYDRTAGRATKRTEATQQQDRSDRVRQIDAIFGIELPPDEHRALPEAERKSLPLPDVEESQ